MLLVIGPMNLRVNMADLWWLHHKFGEPVMLGWLIKPYSLIIRLSKGGDKIAMPKLLKKKTLPLKAEKGVSTSQDSVHFLYQSSKGHADHSGSFHKHIQTYSPILIHKLRHSSKMQAEAPARAVLRSCSTLRTLSPDTTPYLEVTGVKRQKSLG